MLLEYAVEPRAISSSWETFKYLIEKFGFDRGRLISEFPKAWLREVYVGSSQFKTTDRARLEILLKDAKTSKLIRSGRAYDPAIGDWLKIAIAQQAFRPFHAIIASENPTARVDVVIAADTDEAHPLMECSHTWEVPRVGVSIAAAIAPLLRTARKILFVDPFFDLRDPKYRETLKACLDLLVANGSNVKNCEIHFRDHVSRPDSNFVQLHAGTWMAGVIPNGMSITLVAWNERQNCADFHARYILTDQSGINVESGFQAEGAHQVVQLGLLPFALAKAKLDAFALTSIIYELAGPILKIHADGTVQRM
jgi:hypothetical protein